MATTVFADTDATRTAENRTAGHRTAPGDAARFSASPALAANLQRVLVDLIELHLQAKQAHWNVVGPNFRDLHLQLDEIADAARESGDTVAERMRALGASPDGRSDTVAGATTLPAFPVGEQNTAAVAASIATRLYAAVATMRTVHDDVDAEDPSTADVLHGIIDRLEADAWMIGAEVRTAG